MIERSLTVWLPLLLYYSHFHLLNFFAAFFLIFLVCGTDASMTSLFESVSFSFWNCHQTSFLKMMKLNKTIHTWEIPKPVSKINTFVKNDICCVSIFLHRHTLCWHQFILPPFHLWSRVKNTNTNGNLLFCNADGFSFPCGLLLVTMLVLLS